VRGPDHSFIASQRLGPGLPTRGYHEGAPTLAVEVISPDESDEKFTAKIEFCFSAGAERAWEVRPRLRTVTVHRMGAGPRTLTAADTLASDDAAFNLDGFSLPLRDIFA
jgi:Uma2 family endonuclease